MKLRNEMRIWSNGWLGMALVFLLPLATLAQRRDTVTLRGYKFLLAETTDEDDGEEIQVLNLVRILPASSKWLLKHTLHAEYPDCNSVEYEVGGFELSDTNITFYTAWGFTSNALAGMSGVRKQVYEVTPAGKVKPGLANCWVRVGPQHECIRGLEAFEEDPSKIKPHTAAAIDYQTYVTCIEEELGARMVTGPVQKALVREVLAALAPETAAIQKKYADLSFIRCE